MIERSGVSSLFFEPDARGRRDYPDIPIDAEWRGFQADRV